MSLIIGEKAILNLRDWKFDQINLSDKNFKYRVI